MAHFYVITKIEKEPLNIEIEWTREYRLWLHLANTVDVEIGSPGSISVRRALTSPIFLLLLSFERSNYELKSPHLRQD